MSATAGPSFSLEDLERIIVARRNETAQKSYTRSLLDKGAAHCARKFGEEAIEFVVAAAQGERVSTRAEAADVLYHLLVSLQAADLSLSEVMAELESRTAMSGHEEKAARPRS
jgi:phosphoribosyl-ATP pyrophosphohydrolase